MMTEYAVLLLSPVFVLELGSGFHAYSSLLNYTLFIAPPALRWYDSSENRRN